MQRKITVWVLVMAYAAAVYADISEQEHELQRLRSQIKNVTAKVAQLNQEKHSSMIRLADIERKYGKLSSDIRHLDVTVAEKQRRVAKIQQKIASQKQLINQHKQQLQVQVRTAHAMGKQEKLKLIFNQQDAVISSRMMIFYDYFNKARLNKLKFIAQRVILLDSLESQQRDEAIQINMLVLQNKDEQRKLLLAKRERKTLLAALEQDFAIKTQQLSDLRQSEIKLTKLISQLQQAMDDFPLDAVPTEPFAALKGKLYWPINGKILKKFGSIRAGSRWDGVLIAADEGTKVRVITRGRVVYSDWLRGYGLLMIVDHGKEYMTLYAFNQSLYKEEGDWVEAEEVIATVGKSGGRTQSGLYFGIRKNGKPVNPVKWCTKVRQRAAG
jgi:septal ring factor EnvC (AmiA/AmiB activator)